MMKESGFGPNGTQSPDGEAEWIKGPRSIAKHKMRKESRCLED